MNLRIRHVLSVITVWVIVWLVAGYVRLATPTRAGEVTTTPVSTSALLRLPKISVSNVNSIREVAHLEGSEIVGIAWSPAGKLLAVGSANGVSLYSPASGMVPRSLNTDKTYKVVFSPDGNLLASSGTESDGNLVRLWNVETGSLLNTLKGDSLITCLSFSPDSEVLTTGEGDDLNGVPGTIQLWDVRTGTLQTKLEAHMQMVTSVAFSPKGEILVSSSKDRVIRLWNLRTRTEQSSLRGHTDLAGNVAFSPNGTLLAFSDINEDLHGIIRLWDFTKGGEQPNMQTEEGELTSLSFSPDGSMLASGAYDGRLRLWEMSTGKQVIALDAHPHGGTFVVFSPDGTIVATVGADDVLRLWGVPN